MDFFLSVYITDMPDRVQFRKKTKMKKKRINE